MPISNKTAADIVFGPDKVLHLKVRGSMLRLARLIRDDTTGTYTENQKGWARRVMAGDDSSYSPIMRELSVRQVIQDAYVADDHAEGVVQSNVLAVLEAVITATRG